MPLCFPNLAAVRQALTADSVPPAVARRPVRWAVDGQGRAWLYPSVALSAPAALAALRRVGGTLAPGGVGPPAAENAPNWYHLIPLRPEPGSVEPPAAVLLAFADPAALPGVVGELHRLGADRPLVNWPAGGLLRVARPPLATFLRVGRDEGLTAFREQAPGVWVELGHAHPLAERVPRPADRLLLLRPPRQWDWRPAGPFRPLELPADLDLPVQSAALHDAGPPAGARIRVPLGLRATRTEEAPELWVLSDQPFEHLLDLARNVDDRLIGQLSLAVVRAGGRLTAVLRGRAARHRLPELVMPEARALLPHLRLPNLFVPAGARLTPPLRRDAVRVALAADPGAITWVDAGPPAGAWTGLPESAFRPLAGRVDYVVEAPRVRHPWSPGPDPFAPEPFVLRGEEVPVVFPVEEGLTVENPAERPTAHRPPNVVVVNRSRPKQPGPRPAVRRAAVGGGRTDPMVQFRQELRDLERRFREIPGPIDTPERLALWPELARLNAALGQTADAALCWLAALWSAEDFGRARDWLAAESVAAAPAATLLDGLLGAPEAPTAARLRTLAAAVLAAEGDADLAAALRTRGGEVAVFLGRHETLLPVRGAWLAWLGLVRLSAGDTLTLARARDRLLARLLESGLSATIDLPGFLRQAGAGPGRDRVDRSTLLGLRDLLRRGERPGVTAAVLDLIFAYGLARLGERTAAEPLLARARTTGNLPQADAWVVGAYATRVDQALANQPPGGVLPERLLRQRDRLTERERARVDRFRQVSHVLEPFERIDPYRDQRPARAGLCRELGYLAELRDPAALARAFDAVRRASPSAGSQLLIGTAALRAAPRAGEAFARDALDRVTQALDAAAADPDLFRQIDALEAALLAAGHFGQDDRIPALVERLFRVLEPLSGERAAWVVGRVSGQVFRTLGRLGLREDAERLAAEMAGGVLGGGDVAGLANRPAVNWPVVLRALLTVGAGWFYLGREGPAVAVLDEVLRRIRARDLRAEDELELAVGYADLLGRAPADVALPRLEELLTELPALRANGNRPDYLLPRVRVTEAAVLALLRDEFAVGSAVRRWLDEDEDLVRRRIHRDLRAALERAGG
jgi:hypothetical protein